MNSNFRVAYYLDGRPKKDGKITILCRICMGSQRLALGSTGHAIVSSLWSSRRGRVTGNTSEARFINCELDKMEDDLRRFFRKLELTENFSLDMVKTAYLHRGEKPVEESFLSYFDVVLKRKEEEIDHGLVLGTVKKYRTTRKNLEEFLKVKLKCKDIAFSELNYKLFIDFERYLRVNIGVVNNTAKTRLKCVRAVLNEAVREGIIASDPSKDVPMSFTSGNRDFLTMDEIKKLMEYDFTIDRTEKVRDFFVFSCFTGLAYADIATLTYNNIVEMAGRSWIVKNRVKTNVPSNVPLLSIPLQIIEKYRGRSKDNHVFPVMSNQKMNTYLKEIADVCDINKNLTFHVARHTFGTQMVSLGVPFDSVSRMMGHTNMKTTMIYARITDNKIGEDMDRMAERIKDLNGTLANMPDDIVKKVENANTSDKPTARLERPRKQHSSDSEGQPASAIAPASNPVQPDASVLNVKSVRYVDGKMLITSEDGQTLVLNSMPLQVSPQEPETDSSAGKRRRPDKQAAETSLPVVEQHAVTAKVTPSAIPDEVVAPAKKRDRPRKVLEQTTPVAEGAAATPAKKRGRPRKQATEPSMPVVEEQAVTTNAMPAALPDEVTARAKKRGRPRKVLEQTTPVAEGSAAAPAKKRGRPRKQMAEQTSSVAKKNATFTTYSNGWTVTVRKPDKANHRNPNNGKRRNM